MQFEFKIINTQQADSAMYLVNRDHGWGEMLTVESVNQDALIDTVKGRFTYHFANAMDEGFTREMFVTNNIIMVVDRVPSFAASPTFWSNVARAHAIACDWWTWEAIKDVVPSLDTDMRHINLTGVNMWDYTPDNTHKFDKTLPDFEPNDGIVYAGTDDMLFRNLSSYIENTPYRDREDGTKIKIELIQDAGKYRNYNVLIAPKAHSSLWLHAMAHRSELIVHEFVPHLSYALDPRGLSSTLSTLEAEQEAKVGGTAFKQRIINLMDDYPKLLESLSANPYKRPKGDTFVDRVFAEINKSGY